MEIARAHLTSSASPHAFFDRWCDIESHPEWAPSMEYFKLDGPFGVGAIGRSKPRDGVESTFTVTEVGPGFVYADATALDGATLTVRHRAFTVEDATHVVISGHVEGPRCTEVAAEISQGLQEALERDLRSLTHMLESGQR